MIHEFNASEFISILALSHKGNQYTADIEAIFKDAYEIERTHPSIRISLDEFSIDEFCDRDRGNIHFESNVICINNINTTEMKQVLKRCCPEDDFVNLFKKILSR